MPDGYAEKYWLTCEGAKLRERMDDQIDSYYEILSTTGILDLWSRVYQMYYALEGGRHRGGVSFGGHFDERVYLGANHFRSIGNAIQSLVLSNRPAWSPRANNSDPAATAQIPVARDALDYYSRSSRLEEALGGVVERSLLYSFAYLYLSWEFGMGAIVDAERDENGKETGGVRRTGGLQAIAKSPLFVPTDITVPPHRQTWWIARDYRNKHDLIAEYRTGEKKIDDEVREALMNTGCSALSDRFNMLGGPAVYEQMQDTVLADVLIARDTPAVPGGRLVVSVGDVMLFDGPLPGGVNPLIRHQASEMVDTAVGYSPMFDLMGLQEIYDMCLSNAATIVDTFGVPSIAGTEGTEAAEEELGDGPKLIKSPVGAPIAQVLDLCRVPEANFKLRELARSDMQVLPGINDVVRGEPQASLKSGAALALVQAQALVSNSKLQLLTTRLVEEAGDTALKIIQSNAKEQVLVPIVGGSDRGALRAFTRESISKIGSVTMDIGNPLSRTSGGRVQIADTLLERGLLTAEQYFQVLETGRLDHAVDPVVDQQRRADEENEIILSGDFTVVDMKDPVTGEQLLDLDTGEPLQVVQECRALMTQHPKVHVQTHSRLLDHADVVADPRKVQAVRLMVNDHLYVWRTTHPDILTLLGFPVPESTAWPPPGQGAPQEPAQAGGQQAPSNASAGPLPEPAAGQPPPAPGIEAPPSNMPRMPEIPSVPGAPAPLPG